MSRREPLSPAGTGGAHDQLGPPGSPGDGRYIPAPPPIRRDDEVPAVTGEIRPPQETPYVPEFAAPTEKPERRWRSKADAVPDGPVTTKAPGGTVVTFPPKSPPSWQDPSATVTGRVPPHIAEQLRRTGRTDPLPGEGKPTDPQGPQDHTTPVSGDQIPFNPLDQPTSEVMLGAPGGEPANGEPSNSERSGTEPSGEQSGTEPSGEQSGTEPSGERSGTEPSGGPSSAEPSGGPSSAEPSDERMSGGRREQGGGKRPSRKARRRPGFGFQPIEPSDMPVLFPNSTVEPEAIKIDSTQVLFGAETADVAPGQLSAHFLGSEPMPGQTAESAPSPLLSEPPTVTAGLEPPGDASGEENAVDTALSPVLRDAVATAPLPAMTPAGQPDSHSEPDPNADLAAEASAGSDPEAADASPSQTLATTPGVHSYRNRPESPPKVDSQPEPEPASQPEAATGPEAVLEPEAAIEPEAVLEPQSNVESEPTVEVPPKAETRPEAESPPEPEDEAALDPKTELERKVEAAVKALRGKPELEPELEPESWSEPEPNPSATVAAAASVTATGETEPAEAADTASAETPIEVPTDPSIAVVPTAAPEEPAPPVAAPEEPPPPPVDPGSVALQAKAPAGDDQPPPDGVSAASATAQPGTTDRPQSHKPPAAPPSLLDPPKPSGPVVDPDVGGQVDAFESVGELDALQAELSAASGGSGRVRRRAASEAEVKAQTEAAAKAQAGTSSASSFSDLLRPSPGDPRAQLEPSRPSRSASTPVTGVPAIGRSSQRPKRHIVPSRPAVDNRTVEALQLPMVDQPAAKEAPTKDPAEIFASETSVFPAIRTRRGDLLIGQTESADKGGWFTRSAELPMIRVEDEQAELHAPRFRLARRVGLGLVFLVLAAAILIIVVQPFPDFAPLR